MEARKDQSFVGTVVKELPNQSITVVYECSHHSHVCVHFSGPYTKQSLNRKCRGHDVFKVIKD